ncbi:MAG: anti sigma factor C-terminal domain-containing protein [Bacilli bacterium]
MSYFKEIVLRYQRGEATDEEIAFVENEIEKNILLNELLATNISIELEHEEQAHPNENKGIEKEVNKKLRTVMWRSVLIILTLWLTLHFVVSPIMDRYYYNPIEKIGTDASGYKRFEVDYILYNGLFSPGYSPRVYPFYHTENLGFGSYDITIFTNNWFTGKMETLPLSIKRGTSSSPAQLRRLVKSLAVNSMGEVPDVFHSTLDDLKKLPEDTYVKAMLSFPKTKYKSIEEVYTLQENYPTIDVFWIAMNFELGYTTPIGTTASGRFTNETFDGVTFPKPITEGTLTERAEYTRQYFKASLLYLQKQPKFTRILGGPFMYGYQEILEEVEKNNYESPGIMISIRKDELLKIIENNPSYTFAVYDTKLGNFPINEHN